MSGFDLSREQKLSGQIGRLIPTYLEEVVPGDQFNVSTESLVRFAPMIAPVMHRVDTFIHYFFVPNRLVWNQWEDFITGGQDGTSTPTFPTIPMGNLKTDGSPSNAQLADYLGIPNVSDVSTSTVKISELPFRAYQLIWNEYYRDPTLDDEVDITVEGDIIDLRNVRQEKDYFSTALPWPQRGADTEANTTIDYKSASDVFFEDGSDVVSKDLGTRADSVMDDGADNKVRVENIQDISMLINDLRRSSAIQRFLEKQARGGYRYIETILNHFGVRSSDARLQRPEYLGGGKQPVAISEVVSTAETVDSTDATVSPVGQLAGHGVAAGRSNSFTAEFEEHGYVIGMFFVRPKPAYQQGIMRHWLRNDKYDFYWPEFANLGEQAVQNAELYFDDADDAFNAGTFGYQQRYAEYKYGCDSVHGDFRTTLNHWHMGRIFASQPQLNAEFVDVESEDYNRIFAASSGDNLWIQLFHNVKARRPMPYFSDPSLG